MFFYNKKLWSKFYIFANILRILKKKKKPNA